MKIIDLFRRKQNIVATADTRDPNLSGILGGSTSASGKQINSNTAMGIAAAWGCMRVLSETIGSVPWALYRDTGKGNAEKETDHWLSELLASPNSDMTSVEFRETSVLSLSQSGNAYSLKEASGKRVSSLLPIPHGDVRVFRKKGSNTKLGIPEGEPFYRVADRGQSLDLPREKMFHVKGFGSDGLVGLSPLAAARETMGGALASEEFANRFFSQGGLPSATVTVPGWLEEDQREKARAMLNAMITGLGNAHKFALFEGGLKPEPWSTMPLDDMQFLELRKFSVSEICRFYRVPPHMVMDLEKATFSNIEQQGQEFVTYTLMPYFTRIEAAVQKWILPVGDRGKFFLRFNFEGLLRADSAARASFYNSALQNGWMNRNEVRGKENLNRVEGLDEFTVQLNMTPVSELGKEPVQPPVAAPVPVPSATPPTDDTKQNIEVKVSSQAVDDIEKRYLETQQAFEDTAREIANLAKQSARAIEMAAQQAEQSRAASASAIGALAAQADSKTQQLAETLESKAQSTAQQLEETTAAAMKRIQDAADAFAKTAEESLRVQRLPRRLVLDGKGDVIGSEVVEKLH